MTQEIAESPIPKVELPVEYGLGWRTSNRTSNFVRNNPVYWDQFEGNSESIKKNSGDTFQITLSGGKSYRLTGFVNLADATETTVFQRSYQWWNNTKQEFVGSQGGMYSAGDIDAAGGASPAQAYVSLDEDSVFELRCTFASNDVDTIGRGTSFEIQHLQNLKI